MTSIASDHAMILPHRADPRGYDFREGQLFVGASMAPFYGLRRVQDAFMPFASEVKQTCMQEGFAAQPPEATIACWAQFNSWSRTAIDIGAPLVIAAVCLELANRLRYFARQHFVNRLAELKVSPVGSTLFLRAFRDDQVRRGRASRNLFSSVFDLGRMPATLDELMLERLSDCHRQWVPSRARVIAV